MLHIDERGSSTRRAEATGSHGAGLQCVVRFVVFLYPGRQCAGPCSTGAAQSYAPNARRHHQRNGGGPGRKLPPLCPGEPDAPGQTEEKTQESDGAGHFVFKAIPPGPFQLTVTGEGFATQQIPGVLHPGEVLEVPLISLPIAAATTEVRVSVTNYELAEEQVKVEEKQRVLGVIPNFYVSYQQDALPLRHQTEV